MGPGSDLLQKEFIVLDLVSVSRSEDLLEKRKFVLC